MITKKKNREDQDLLDAFEADEFESDLTENRRSQLAKFAKETIKKDKRIIIRISRRDLEALHQHEHHLQRFLGSARLSVTVNHVA